MTSRTHKVFALSLGQALAAVVALGTGMVLSREFSQADLATYRQTFLAYDVAGPLLSLGLTTALYYFLPGETRRGRGVIVDALVMMVAVGLLYGLFILLGGNRLLAMRFTNPAIAETLRYLAPYPLVMLPAALLPAVLVVRDRTVQLGVFNMANGLALGAGIIAVCLLAKSPGAVVAMRVAVAIVAGLVAVALMLRAAPRDDARPDWSNMKAMVRYSLPLALASMLGSLCLQVDKLIVSSLCSPSEFAVYSNGAVEVPMVGMITGAIATVVLVDMAASCKAGRTGEALALFHTAAVRSAWMLFPITVFLMVHADDLIVVLFSAKYAGSAEPFRVLLGLLPGRIVLYGSALMALGMSRVVLYRSIGDLAVNAVLCWVLVRQWGMIGGAWATLLMFFGWCVPFNLVAIGRGFGCGWWRVLPLRRLAAPAGAAVLAGGAAWGLARLTSPFGHLPALGAGAAIFGAVYAVIVWGLSAELRELVRARWVQFAGRAV